MRVDVKRAERKKLGRLFYDFRAKNLTGFGGLAGFYTFVRKVGLERELSGLELGYQPRRYPVSRILCCLILGLTAGFVRVRETARLGRDKTLLRILGWDGFPVQSTLSRSLNRFTSEAVSALVAASANLLRVFRRNWEDYRVLHLDLDSHVRTIYGEEIAEAKRGYNPNKKGRRSYHPLLAFIGETRDFLRGRLRAGNAVSSTGAVGFLQECFEQLDLERLDKLVVRADSGFCNKDFLQALESNEKIIYVMAMRLYSTHQVRFAGLNFSPIPGAEALDDFEIAEYQSADWSDGKRRRVIVVRQPISESEPQNVTGKQLKLFALKDYTWRAFVTNSEAPAEEVWRDYNQRATCENHIKEAISFGLDWTASSSFLANSAHFQLVMLTYNLFNWYKEVAFQQDEHRNTVGFLRACIIHVPAIVKRSSRRLIVSFSTDWPWARALKEAFARIERWSPLPIPV